ncbi:hypothetical protein MRX96_027339 [Rhipicephalus microplus]
MLITSSGDKRRPNNVSDVRPSNRGLREHTAYRVSSRCSLCLLVYYLFLILPHYCPSLVIVRCSTIKPPPARVCRLPYRQLLQSVPVGLLPLFESTALLSILGHRQVHHDTSRMSSAINGYFVLGQHYMWHEFGQVFLHLGAPIGQAV